MPVDDWRLVARLDWTLSTRATAFVRYAWQDLEYPDGYVSTSPYRGFETRRGRQEPQRARLAHLRLLAPVDRADEGRLQPAVPGRPSRPSGPTRPLSSWAASSIPEARILTAFPGYCLSAGQRDPLRGPQKLLQVYEDVNLVSGRHDLRIGGSFVRMMDDRTFAASCERRGVLGTTAGRRSTTSCAAISRTSSRRSTPRSKYPGDTVTLPLGEPDFTRHNRYNEWALYVNDTWSVAARVKLNLGLRYERYGVQRNTDPSLDSNFYYGTGATDAEQIRNGRVWPAPESPVGGLWRPDRNDFAPRVGFAWDLTGDGKTSLRAGYGIGYERNFGNVTYNVIQNPPRYAVVTLRSGVDIPQSENLITTDNRGPLAGTGEVAAARARASGTWTRTSARPTRTSGARRSSGRSSRTTSRR